MARRPTFDSVFCKPLPCEKPMRLPNVIVVLAILLCSPVGFAQTQLKMDSDPAGSTIMVQAAPGLIHFRPSDEHVRFSWLVGAEWLHQSRWLLGYSYFNNSFGQKSQYIYGGRWWPISERYPNLYVKLTGGVLLGYKKPYEDKVPFNHNGVSPGIVPALGYKSGPFNVQMNLLGGAGVMFTAGYDLIR